MFPLSKWEWNRTFSGQEEHLGVGHSVSERQALHVLLKTEITALPFTAHQ